MSLSNLVVTSFAVLGAVSIFIFVYCVYADRHDDGSGRNNH